MERKKESITTFFLRSLEFRLLEFVESRVKVHLLDESYAWVPKRRGFTEDPRNEFSGNKKFSGLGGVIETSFSSSMLQQVDILSTLAYFSH